LMDKLGKYFLFFRIFIISGPRHGRID